MQTPAQQAASRSSVDPATWRLHRLWAIERKTIDLECLTHACGALAGAPSLASRPCASPAKQKRVKTNPARHASAQPLSGPSGGAHCAPEPLSMRLRTHIPVPRTSARRPQKPPPRVWLLWNDGPGGGIKAPLILFDVEFPIAIKVSREIDGSELDDGFRHLLGPAHA